MEDMQSTTMDITPQAFEVVCLDWQRNHLPAHSVDHTSVELAAPRTASILTALRPPETKGRVFHQFFPVPLEEAGEESRRQASRQRAPEGDSFAALFFLLLAERNWDARVEGLDALLAAYPENKRPFPFQLEGIQFLSCRLRALLADEMGLGKTVQAILAMRIRIHTGMVQRVLIVCPKSLLLTWLTEISIWAPELSVSVVHGPSKHDAISRKHHVYITNYETVSNLVCGQDGRQRREIRPFDLMIVDEIQYLKNPAARKSIAVTSVIADQRWALTGTPLENSFADYRTVWSVIEPALRNSRISDYQFLATTKRDVLRREKSTVLKELPDKIIKIQLVELEGPQLERYRELETQARRELSISLEQNPTDRPMHVVALLVELKMQCVFDEASRTSAKLDSLKEKLEEMHPKGVDRNHCQKALIFTQFPNLVCDTWKFLESLKKFNPLRFDGSLHDKARYQFTNAFQFDEVHRMAIVSLKAGGTGLTLTRANQVVFLDQWWNPAVMAQAAARVHRIGQTKMCEITSLIAKDTIDERILKILERKQSLFEKVMQEVGEGREQAEDLSKLENALSIDDMLEALGLPRSPV